MSSVMANQWQQLPQPHRQPSHYQAPPQFAHQPLHLQHPQYQQPGPYPQPGQYQQSLPYYQPQHYALIHNNHSQQGYNGYQTPQQYPPQQPPPAQHNAPQYGMYEQTYQQQANSAIYAQSPSQMTTSQACYNCASPDHFAQNCPEAKREVPAGALDPVRFANPLKRPRPGSTIVTRYQSAPHNPMHASSQGYGPAPSTQGQPSYRAHQAQQSPATPTAIQSPEQQQYVQQQWQQYYAQQQAYQQGNHRQQGSFTQQQAYEIPFTPAGAFANGARQPDQASQQIVQNVQACQVHHNQYTQEQQPQIYKTSAMPIQYSQQPSSMPAKAVAMDQNPQSGSCMKPRSNSSWTHEDVDADTGVEEEDLDLLDILSAPPSPLRAGLGSYLPNTLVTPPASLLCMPLPANFVVADTLYPIAPPAPDKDGCCQSKYFRDKNLELFRENIKNSKYWKDHKDDPIFSESLTTDNVIPLDELLSRLQERHVNGELNEDSIRKTRSLSHSVLIRQNSGDFRGDLETLERDLAKLKAEMERKERVARGRHISPSQPTTPQTTMLGAVEVKDKETSPVLAMSEKAPMSAQQTEDVLASLGVTGPPKPIMRPYQPSTYGSPNGKFPSQSGSNSKAEVIHQSKDQQIIGLPLYPEGSAPPPPRQPQHQRFSTEGTSGSPFSDPPHYVKPCTYNTNGGDDCNGSSKKGIEVQSSSPSDLHPDPSGSRKRNYARRDSISDEEETPARRQEDDVTPKHKRRAPKVHEAYGRRW